MTLKCPTRSNLRWPSTACLTSSPVLSPHLLCSNHTDLAVPRALQPCSFLRAFVLADPFIGMLLSQTLHLSRLCLNIFSVQFSSVHLLSPVWLFGTPWTAARQASLSITNSLSLPKFMSIESVQLSSVSVSSVIHSCPTLGNPMSRSTPGLPIHHQLPEFTQIHVHWVSDAIQSSHPLSSPSPPALNLSQHQGLFKWVSSSHQVAKILEFQLQHQSFQWTPRTDLL